MCVLLNHVEFGMVSRFHIFYFVVNCERNLIANNNDILIFLFFNK